MYPPCYNTQFLIFWSCPYREFLRAASDEANVSLLEGSKINKNWKTWMLI